MHIYCDESGGVGRGVMTLAAVTIAPEAASRILAEFRAATGLRGELKGSRIDFDERDYFYRLFVREKARAVVGLAITAMRPRPGEDRGELDRQVYGALLNDVIGHILPETGGCAQIIFDDGRYDPATLAGVREEIAAMLSGLGTVSLDMSHHQAGLQIADVVANSFFNRALVSERQGAFISLLEPLITERRIRFRILDPVEVI
jgi:hypothetical protein